MKKEKLKEIIPLYLPLVIGLLGIVAMTIVPSEYLACVDIPTAIALMVGGMKWIDYFNLPNW